MLSLAVSGISLAGGILFLLALRQLLDGEAFRRVNYAGRTVPTSAGILFVPVVILAWVSAEFLDDALGGNAAGAGGLVVLLVVGMCLLGLIDDLAGDRGETGFRGHFRALARGRLTTGMIKAVVGFLLAMAVSFPFSKHVWDVFLNAAVIALCANLFNLLDMRPGRALKVFLPLLALVVYLNWDPGGVFTPYALAVGACAVVLLPGDLKESFMLGDAGSNVLGSVIGLGLVLGLPGWWRLGVMFALTALNLLSERFSFTRVIASSRVLNWLDTIGRKGERAGNANNY